MCLKHIAGLCKGSTPDSDSVCEGSNPSPAAKKRNHILTNVVSFFASGMNEGFELSSNTPVACWQPVRKLADPLFFAFGKKCNESFTCCQIDCLICLPDKSGNFLLSAKTHYVIMKISKRLYRTRCDHAGPARQEPARPDRKDGIRRDRTEFVKEMK